MTRLFDLDVDIISPTKEQVNRGLKRGAVVGAAMAVGAGAKLVAAAPLTLGGPAVGLPAALTSPLLLSATIPASILAATWLVPAAALAGAGLASFHIHKRMTE